MKETCSLEEWGKIADAAMRQDAGINNRYKTISFVLLSQLFFQPRCNLLKKQLTCSKNEPISKKLKWKATV